MSDKQHIVPFLFRAVRTIKHTTGEGTSREESLETSGTDGRTPLHEAALSVSEYTSGAIYQLVDKGANVNAADKDGRTPLHEAAQSGSEYAYRAIFQLIDDGNLGSVRGLESIVRFLGFNEDSPESAVVTASCSDNEEDAILLLQLGVDPILVSREWWSRYGTAAEREMPRLLTLWENSVKMHDYGTIKQLVRDITGYHHVSFNSITWEWEIPAIPASDLESDVVLVCTNPRTQLARDFGHVHASTYQEYLKHCKWTDFIMETLDILARIELDSTYGDTMYAMRDPPVWITCTYANLSINFGNKQTCLAALDLIEVLDWLCKSMRTTSNKDGHVVSSAAYRLERYAITQVPEYGPSISSDIQLHKLRPFVSLKMSSLPEVEHNCWLSLFNSCVIVESPLTPRDGFGKGLETSFDLMIALAASEFCLKIKGSLVFLGYRTVLYPVAIDGNCVQFHLFTTTDGQINPYTLDLENAMYTDNTSQFRTMRCFVGWCEVAHINLGTQQMPTDVGYSGGQDQSRSLEPDGYALLGQIGASAPLSAIMGLQKNYKYSRHRIRFTPTNNYLKLLHDTSKQSVVLYDAVQRRCWLVPKLSVLLHMSQIFSIRCGAGSDGKIPYVQPHTDDVEIIEVLEPAGEISILEGQVTKYLFRELLFALTINLLDTAEAVRDSNRGKLYGFEFMDIVGDPGKGTCMKRLDIQSKKTAWLDLVNAVCTVIVCSNLGEAISAAEGSTRNCTTCNRVPQSQDYFAATLQCLSRLAEQRGVNLRVGSDCIKIADKAVWKIGMNPFIPCSHEEDSNETCWDRPGLIQQVARLPFFNWSPVSYPSRAQAAQPYPANGGVVFG